MADPLSIVSVIEGSLSLILQCGNVVKTLNDIASKYKQAKLSVQSMIQELNTIELAWNRIREWAQNNAGNPSDTKFLERLDRSLECGTLVMSALQQDLSEYTTAGMGFKLRSKAAWNERALQDHQHRIRGQAIAMSLLLQVLELPIPKDRSGLLRTMASLLRTSDESAYSVAPSRASSRMSMSKDGTSSCISNARSDMNFRRLSCEDDLIVAKVYKRIQKKNLLRQLFQAKAKNASGGTPGRGVNIGLVDQGKLPRHEHALANLENVMLPPTCLPSNPAESISPLRLPASNGQRKHSDTIKVNESVLDAEAEFAVAETLDNKTASLTTSNRQHVGQVQDHTTDAILTEGPPSAQSLESTRAANIRRPHRCIGTSSQLSLNETLISANIFEELLHVTGLSGRAGSSMISLRFLTAYGEQIRNHLEQLELMCRSDGDQANTTGNPIMDSNSTSLILKHDIDSSSDAGLGDRLRQLEVAYIAEHCSVGWDPATKALEKMGDRETAVQMLRGTMTPAALSFADVAEKRILLRDWKALLALIELEFRSKTEMRSQIRLGKVPIIAYEDLCYVFRPGDIVLSSHGKRLQALAVLNIRNGQDILIQSLPITTGNLATSQVDRADMVCKPITHDSDDFVMDCFYYDFDGVNFGPVLRNVSISKYERLIPVASLAIVPLTVYDDGIEEHLVARGRHFVRLCTFPGAHRAYKGLTLDRQPSLLDSEVIIDFQLALQLTTSWLPSLGVHLHAAWTQPYIRTWTAMGREEKGVEPFILKLFSYRIYGFILRSRTWAPLDISGITDIEFCDDSFSKMVLPQGHKELIQALVESERLDNDVDPHSFDIVRGKGKGLVILLHGSPGTGKTLTAECVAEYTHKPLLKIKSADMGDISNEVEKNLETYFNLASRWGCVSLLDEADVFLLKRGRNRMQNSIVSVFLRALEYFSGIVFLTTNRVETFDESIVSRIHVSLYYPPLSRAFTAAVWEMNLKRLSPNTRPDDINFEEIMEFAMQQFDSAESDGHRRWNGRQIRNAFQTAAALADWDARAGNAETPKLTRAIFEIVGRASSDFGKHLAASHTDDGAMNDVESSSMRGNTQADPLTLAPELGYSDSSAEDDGDGLDQDSSAECLIKRKSTVRKKAH